jgi:hypothetical protein
MSTGEQPQSSENGGSVLTECSRNTSTGPFGDVQAEQAETDGLRVGTTANAAAQGQESL